METVPETPETVIEEVLTVLGSTSSLSVALTVILIGILVSPAAGFVLAIDGGALSATVPVLKVYFASELRPLAAFTVTVYVALATKLEVG